MSKGEEDLNSILAKYYQKGYNDGFERGCEGCSNMINQFKDETLKRIGGEDER